jgi:hypothetical protein
MPRHSSRTHSGRRGLACWVGQFKVKLVETKMFCYAACSRIRSRCRYLARYGGARYHRDGGVPQIQQRGAACRCQLARAGPGLQLPVPEERGKSADAAFSLRQCTLQTWILTVTPPLRRSQAAYALGTGHSSHCTNVRFSADDSFLFSTGGKDRSIFQWKATQKKKAGM